MSSKSEDFALSCPSEHPVNVFVCVGVFLQTAGVSIPAAGNIMETNKELRAADLVQHADLLRGWTATEFTHFLKIIFDPFNSVNLLSHRNSCTQMSALWFKGFICLLSGENTEFK